MTESSRPDVTALERAIELFVLAPLGASMQLAESGPDVIDGFVRRGRIESEELTRRVTNLRVMGEAAIAFGLPVLQRRVERHTTDARHRAEQWFRSIGAARPARRAPRSAPTMANNGNGPESGNGVRPTEAWHAATVIEPLVESPSDRPAESGPPSSDLAIPGYDALSASQVVERLMGLGGAELDAVRIYERTHRNRRTILGKIDQLIP